MKTIQDLHNTLMKELDRLDTTPVESLDTEIERAKAIAGIANMVIENGKLTLKAQEVVGEYSTAKDVVVPGYLIGEKTVQNVN